MSYLHKLRGRDLQWWKPDGEPSDPMIQAMKANPKGGTYTEAEVTAREQRLVRVVVERAADIVATCPNELCETKAGLRAKPSISIDVLADAIRQLASPENVAAMISEANNKDK